MKKFALIILILTAGISFTAAQSKEEKKETKKMEMKQEKMDHSKMKGCGSAEKSCCNKESKAEVSGKAWNSVCPVKGGEIDHEGSTVEYNGKYHGFCCAGCEDKFSSDPDKYSKNLSEDGQSFTGKK